MVVENVREPHSEDPSWQSLLSIEKRTEKSQSTQMFDDWLSKVTSQQQPTNTIMSA